MATSSSFSGSAVVIVTSTFSDLIGRCRVFLNDISEATWTTEMIGTFLNDAVRDYSQYFPRVKSDTISLTTGTNIYDLNDDFISIRSVEYPSGEDPPIYLERKNFLSPSWWDSTAYYDLMPHLDDSDPDQIAISPDPTTGESVIVLYNAEHKLMADPSSPAETNTVPEYHQHLLEKYVSWKATMHLVSAEQQDPTSNSSLLMAQLAQNARRFELSYSTALQQAIYAAEGLSEHHSWAKTEESMERIY